MPTDVHSIFGRNACVKEGPHFTFLNSKPPFRKNQVKQLGKHFAGLGEAPRTPVSEITGWYNELARQVATTCKPVALQALGSQFRDEDLHIAFRVKSASTIADKVLNRNMQLSYIDDFAGARLNINCLHSSLFRVADAIVNEVEKSGNKAEIKNHIDSPQQGYRAIHVCLNAPAGKAEIQLRTTLQSEWANAYERLADLTGRRVRYEEDYIPEDAGLATIHEELLKISDLILIIEETEEKIHAQQTQIAELLRSQKPGLSFSPKFHSLRAEALATASEAENTRSRQAQATVDLVNNLRALRYSLIDYPQQ